jgi:nucleoside-diphosphate-sugar epimerase
MEIQTQTLDATKARVLLNWTASWSLAEALAETVRWYREHLPATTAKALA